MSSLAVPLKQSQVKAAGQLYNHLPRWAATDRALNALAEQFPDCGPESALLKVAALNQLYRTNVYAVARMAEHVGRVMAAQNDGTLEADLVERLATLPTATDDEKGRVFLSFASKFVHFYVDRERFPIYDSYAVKMLTYHLGRKGQVIDNAQPYRAFLINLAALRERLDFPCGNRELDRYLWLAGLCRAWVHSPKAQINTEVAALLNKGTPETAAILAALLPSVDTSGSLGGT